MYEKGDPPTDCRSRRWHDSSVKNPHETAFLVRPLCSPSFSFHPVCYSQPLQSPCYSNMTAQPPDDVFTVSSSTALAMAENLLLSLNIVVGNLPEIELRKIRDALENSLRVTDDLLFNITICSAFDVLTLGDGMYEQYLLFAYPHFPNPKQFPPPSSGAPLPQVPQFPAPLLRKEL